MRVEIVTDALERPHMTCSCGAHCFGGSRRVVEPVSPDYEGGYREAEQMGWPDLMDTEEVYAVVRSLVNASLRGLLVIPGEETDR